MPETHKTVSNEVLAKILAPYDSAEQMSRGQLKGLISVSTSLIPTDIPWGFAQKLADGELAKIISLGIAEKRRDWRLLHSRLQETAQIVVPKTLRTTIDAVLAEHRRQFGSEENALVYTGTRAGEYSLVGEYCPARDTTFALMCTATGEIDRARLIEALGGGQVIKKRTAFANLCLTPVQAIATLFNAGMGDLWEEPILFLVAQSHKGDPLFIAAEYRGSGKWNFIEDCWDEPSCGVEKGYRFVFARSLFLGL